MQAEIVETDRKFIVKMLKGAERFCLQTEVPDGAVARLKDAAGRNESLLELAKNPKAMLGFLMGISLKALWETIFCPVHGVLGKLLVAAVMVGAGWMTAEHWEAVSGVLEWLLPTTLLARAGWQIYKVRRAAREITAIPDEKIEIAAIPRAKCSHEHKHSGFFTWKDAKWKSALAMKPIVLHKPKTAYLNV